MARDNRDAPPYHRGDVSGTPARVLHPTPAEQDGHMDASKDSVADPRAEIARLQREHHELERQLEDLVHRVHLTPEEELEVRRIKHLKLLKKDRIQLLRSRLRSAESA